MTRRQKRKGAESTPVLVVTLLVSAVLVAGFSVAKLETTSGTQEDRTLVAVSTAI